MTTRKKLKDKLTMRKSLVSSLETVEAFIEAYEAERDFPQVAVRLEMVDQLYRDYTKVQTDIEKLDSGEAPLVRHLQERQDFETRYCTIKGWLMTRRMVNLDATINGPVVNSPPQRSNFHLRLPKIDLPKFDGDYSRWLGFRDTFKSMVHDVAEIPVVAKLQFLLQSLEGEARKPYESVDIEAGNYMFTWEALLKRYDDKRFLKKQLFRALYDLAQIRKESPHDLHNLVDDFQRHVKALAKLGEVVTAWDTPLVSMLSYKLDTSTLRAWEEHASKIEQATYENFVEFLYQRVRILQTVSSEIQHRTQATPVKVVASNPFPKRYQPLKSVANTASSTPRPNLPTCIACSQKHYLFQCPTFQALSISQRREMISQKRLCWNCFKSSHIARSCDSKYTCRLCHERHHTLLHQSSNPAQNSKTSSNPAIQQPFPSPVDSVDPIGSAHPTTEVSMPAQRHLPSTVFLSTVALLIVDQFGNEHSARALIDSGSQSNFMSKKLARRLCLRPERVNIPISGIGEATVTVTESVLTTIRSKVERYTSQLEFLVLPKPTAELPSMNVDVSTWNIPAKVTLADPTFNTSSSIDVILGIEQFHEFLKGGRITLKQGSPVLVETVFGWAVTGRWHGSTVQSYQVCHTALTHRSLEDALERFWELETVEPGRFLSPDENSCEELFESTTSRDINGRYIVRLPKSQNPLVRLGESRSIAEKRLIGLERRLGRDAGTKTAYHEFMDEYLSLGHMRKVSEPVDDTVSHSYLPHHPVFKATSTTTKMRVVFDASCKTSSGCSLNDLLLVGPVVQEDLLSIVMRFRTKPIALVADTEKMYRQVEVHRDDQPLQRILWRKNPSDPISTFELLTVTYGTASAPYLATRTLIQLVRDEGERFPLAKAAVVEDFYVDDFISGAEDLKSALLIRRQTTEMLKSAGFPLRKWASNSSEVLSEIPEADLGIKPFYNLSEEQSVTTLGLVWEPKSDTLRFRIQLPLPVATLTRRNVLSYIAQIYDPLGLVGPVICTAKQFMQRLWALIADDGKGYSWDDPLPQKLQREWKDFHTELNLLSQVRVPRYVSVAGAKNIQLHFFSDASEKAYGACVYVRSENHLGNMIVNLLAAKSKIAPLKTRHSIARLELCAAVLAVQLFKKVTASLKFPVNVFFWVDSMTVLQWLKSPPSCWKTFVGNRVSKIQVATVGHPWNHVPGIDNPADEISRGLTPAELIQQQRWWTGPPWLTLSKDHWPNQPVDANPSTITFAEERKTCLVSLKTPNTDISNRFFNHYSLYSKLKRAVAYFIRYIRELHAFTAKKHPGGACAAAPMTPNEPFPYLTSSDLQEAERSLCRLAQRDCFSAELTALRTGNPVDKSSAMKWLNPRISSGEVIRVGGRLGNSTAQEDIKHPILISGKHRLATLLGNYYHRMLLHAGPQLMTNALRQKFWLLGGRDLLRQVYHQCHTCFRRKPVLVEQPTADLPVSRVTPSRPFSVTGLDYCGPIYLRGPHRKSGPVKAYVSLFVCFSTRAVHLELVRDLTTAAFIAALRRFVARRGKIRELHSDNATNYRGAANELNQLYRMLKTNDSSRKIIFDWCANSEITWKFIPPRAPHFGGLWEAAIKSAKNHLLKEVGNTILGQDEMETLLAEVEMCLNSRPITQMSSDPADLEALTPGHFLVGSNLQALPEKDYKQVPDNRLNCWQLVQKRMQQIWKRWYPEYLQQLQTRSSKGIKAPLDIMVNQLVIIKDDNIPPAQWPLGRITKIHPGKDGIVRVVTLKTAAANEVTRPVAKIAILPMPSDPLDDPTGAEGNELNA